jgi:drug/metabolite transporter (DMT)-like permease
VSILVLGLLCTAVAFVLYNLLITHIGPRRASVITYVNPVVAVAFGVAFLGEHPAAGAVAGLLLILGGSWISTSGRTPPSVLVGRRAAPGAAAREGSPAPTRYLDEVALATPPG